MRSEFRHDFVRFYSYRERNLGVIYILIISSYRLNAAVIGEIIFAPRDNYSARGYRISALTANESNIVISILDASGNVIVPYVASAISSPYALDFLSIVTVILRATTCITPLA